VPVQIIATNNIVQAIQPAQTTVTTTTSSGGVSPSEIPSLVAYTHNQASASTTWTIEHNLNFMPNVTVVDSGGNLVEANVTYTSVTALSLSFSSAISGVAYLS
jgi:hypothetical protein